MRRKIVKQGAATLTVSLPSSWTKKFSLKSGDEIEVEEKDKVLVLSTATDFSSEKIKINIDDANSSQIWGRLNGIYRRGFDEIEVFFRDAYVKDKDGRNIKTVELLQNIADRLMGVEIVRQGRNYVLLKQVSNVSPDEFESLLRRTFYSLKLMADDCFNAAKTSDKDTLRNISTYSDLTINKLTNYCFRILSKQGHKEYSHTPYYFLIVHLMEELGDVISFIAKKCHKNLPSRDVACLMEKTCGLMALFDSAFFNADKKTVIQFYKKRDEIKKEADRVSEKKEHYEVQMLSALRDISNLASEALSAKLNITQKDY